MGIGIDEPTIGIGLGARTHVQTHEDLSIHVFSLNAIHRFSHDVHKKFVSHLRIFFDCFDQFSCVVVFKLTSVILHGAGVARLCDFFAFSGQVAAIAFNPVFHCGIRGVTTPVASRLRHT